MKIEIIVHEAGEIITRYQREGKEQTTVDSGKGYKIILPTQGAAKAVEEKLGYCTVGCKIEHEGKAWGSYAKLEQATLSMEEILKHGTEEFAKVAAMVAAEIEL